MTRIFSKHFSPDEIAQIEENIGNIHYVNKLFLSKGSIELSDEDSEYVCWYILENFLVEENEGGSESNRMPLDFPEYKHDLSSLFAVAYKYGIFKSGSGYRDVYNLISDNKPEELYKFLQKKIFDFLKERFLKGGSLEINLDLFPKFSERKPKELEKSFQQLKEYLSQIKGYITYRGDFLSDLLLHIQKDMDSESKDKILSYIIKNFLQTDMVF